MNLVTRETIISEETRSISEVMPIYGSFQSPYFEKLGKNRNVIHGEMDPLVSAAAVKIRVGRENHRFSVTYSLIIYLAKYDNFGHGL